MYNDRYLNGLIPHLISKNISTASTIKKRLILKSLFSEVEDKASHHLKMFVNHSHRRYQEMKSGNQLEAVISHSKQKNDDYAEDILKDDFNSRCNVKEDKQFLREKIVMQNVKDVDSVIKEVQSYSKTLNKEQRDLRDNCNDNNDRQTQLDIHQLNRKDSIKRKKLQHYNSAQSLMKPIEIEECRKRETSK